MEQDTIITMVQDMGNTSLNNLNIRQKSGQNVHAVQTEQPKRDDKENEGLLGGKML